MNAVISPCGTYRYVLTRKIPSVLRWVKPALFIMLNPSTADAVQDDPTIRRCISFAEREGCTQLRVVNLFALRATDPRELATHEDPIGPENDSFLRSEILVSNAVGGLIVAAWGANKFAKDRACSVVDNFHQLPLMCLGNTKDGSPRHPLYVKSDQSLLFLPT